MKQIRDGLKNSIFWDQIWPNLGLNDGHAWAKTVQHITKLINLNTFHIKNIPSKFLRNLMSQIRDTLKTAYPGTKYDIIWA